MFDRIWGFFNVAIMEDFYMNFKKETYGGFKHLSWLMFMPDDSRMSAPISRVGRVYISLFYITLIKRNVISVI